MKTEYIPILCLAMGLILAYKGEYIATAGFWIASGVYELINTIKQSK